MADNGITRIQSTHSVDELLAKLLSTSLMLAAPSISNLPLKILLSEEDDGIVWLSYKSAEYLQRRHLPAELLSNVSIVETLARTAANEKAA